jgi:hypothetical protein
MKHNVLICTLIIFSIQCTVHAMESWPNFLSPQLRSICSAAYVQAGDESKPEKKNFQLCEQLHKLLHCHVMQKNNCLELYPDIEQNKYQDIRDHIEKTFYNIFLLNKLSNLETEQVRMKNILNQITNNVDAQCFSSGSNPTCLENCAKKYGFPTIRLQMKKE